jgi:hypothetical protein
MSEALMVPLAAYRRAVSEAGAGPRVAADKRRNGHAKKDHAEPKHHKP